VRRTSVVAALAACAVLCGPPAVSAGSVVFENQCKAPVAGSLRNQLGDAIFQFYLDPGQVIRFSGEHHGPQTSMADLPWTITVLATERFAAGDSATASIRSPETRAVNISCAKELTVTVKIVPQPQEPPPDAAPRPPERH